MISKKGTEFKPGCFKVSIKTQTPIVPVALIESYKAWNSSYIRTVTTQVHFLEPIYYEEYKGMKLIINMPDATGEVQWDGISACIRCLGCCQSL